MRLAKVCMAALLILWGPGVVAPAAGNGAIKGNVTYTGTPAKAEPINMSKQPECIKMRAKPLWTEKVVTGPENSLGNVLVYISAGTSDTSPVPTTAVNFNQR